MDPADFRAQLEYDLTWRQDELRHLRNQFGLTSISGEGYYNLYSKVLVVMLYSHFEGFCKYAFKLYIDAINDDQITCLDASEYIAAAYLTDIFQDIENPQRKNNKRCHLFKGPLEPKSIEKFRQFFQHIRFIGEIENILSTKIHISDKISDNIVDTKSNLGPDVVEKILYRLGLPHDNFGEYNGKIRTLVSFRDEFAHGKSNIRCINMTDYNNIETEIYSFMSELMILLTDAIDAKYYLKSDR